MQAIYLLQSLPKYFYSMLVYINDIYADFQNICSKTHVQIPFIGPEPVVGFSEQYFKAIIQKLE